MEKLKLIFAVLILTVIASCKKNDIKKVTSTGIKDVYAVGYVSQGAGNTVAMVWKNELGTALASTTQNTTADMIFTSGPDVYIRGGEFIDNKYIPRLWKNGAEVNFTLDTSSSYSSIVVSGQTVWKSKVPKVVVPPYYSLDCEFVSGEDIYFAADGPYDYAGMQGTIYTTLWKNGVATTLSRASTDPNALINTHAAAIYVSGSDVYVAGTESKLDNTYTPDAALWKNNVITILNPESDFADAYSVLVDGPDVYVAGDEAIGNSDYSAVIWKNGVRTALTDGATRACANAVLVVTH